MSDMKCMTSHVLDNTDKLTALNNDPTRYTKFVQNKCISMAHNVQNSVKSIKYIANSYQYVDVLKSKLHVLF